MRTLVALAFCAARAFGQAAGPPGDPTEHHAAGYARVMCNAVFVTGLDPEFAAENVGYFVAPYEMRAKLGKPTVDRASRTVRVGKAAAQVTGSQGCVNLPLHFKPVTVAKRLDSRGLPGGDTAPFRPVVDAAFADPAAMTAAFVVVHKGRVVAERYAPGITERTALESWSMGKSVTATLLGTLIRDGVYRLDQPAPIPEWQKTPGDPRAKIRIADLLHMSSGLRCRAPNDPDFDPKGPYPDHLYLYTTPGSAFEYAATRPVEWAPNTKGRYRNCDPVLVNYLIRLAVEKRGEEYLSFPQRALFDKLGMGTMVLETDSHGNFQAQGYDLAAARDWARLGLLYLQDGVWNGQRILAQRGLAVRDPQGRLLDDGSGRAVYDCDSVA
jgi:CubicO group peptidase (beta-lactamase class C family)